MGCVIGKLFAESTEVIKKFGKYVKNARQGWIAMLLFAT